MVIDYYHTDSAKFIGKGRLENDYLKNTPFPKAGSFLDGGGNVKPTLIETINEITKAAKSRMGLLKEGVTFSNNFIVLENIRIKVSTNRII